MKNLTKKQQEIFHKIIELNSRIASSCSSMKKPTSYWIESSGEKVSASSFSALFRAGLIKCDFGVMSQIVHYSVSQKEAK